MRTQVEIIKCDKCFREIRGEPKVIVANDRRAEFCDGCAGEVWYILVTILPIHFDVEIPGLRTVGWRACENREPPYP